MTEPWKELGTDAQLRLLNQACQDLGAGIKWHGFRLSKDDWRHFVSATIMGWRILPGIDMGQGPPGMVMLGGSSKKLKKAEATQAIELCFAIGDDPHSYDPTQDKPVTWSDLVMRARGFNPADFQGDV